MWSEKWILDAHRDLGSLPGTIEPIAALASLEEIQHGSSHTRLRYLVLRHRPFVLATLSEASETFYYVECRQQPLNSGPISLMQIEDLISADFGCKLWFPFCDVF